MTPLNQYKRDCFEVREVGNGFMVTPVTPIIGRPITPRGMASVQLTPPMRECVEQVALDVFADMSNAGKPFAECLIAVFLSGMDAALAGEKK